MPTRRCPLRRQVVRRRRRRHHPRRPVLRRLRRIVEPLRGPRSGERDHPPGHHATAARRAHRHRPGSLSGVPLHPVRSARGRRRLRRPRRHVRALRQRRRATDACGRPLAVRTPGARTRWWLASDPGGGRRTHPRLGGRHGHEPIAHVRVHDLGRRGPARRAARHARARSHRVRQIGAVRVWAATDAETDPVDDWRVGDRTYVCLYSPEVLRCPS